MLPDDKIERINLWREEVRQAGARLKPTLRESTFRLGSTIAICAYMRSSILPSRFHYTGSYRAYPRPRQHVDQALRVLKKKLQQEGIVREMRLREHFEKPSEKRAREKEEGIRRARKLAQKKLNRELGLGTAKKSKSPGQPMLRHVHPDIDNEPASAPIRTLRTLRPLH